MLTIHPRALRFVVVLVPADGLLSKGEKRAGAMGAARGVMRLFGVAINAPSRNLMFMGISLI